MKWWLALACCACLSAADVPRLFFSKSFPGSAPAYVAINLDKTGAGDYKEAEDDDNPARFQLTEPEVSEIFALAEKLGYFDHPLESGLKVAFMGSKTFRFTDGARKSEVKFNFSEDADARCCLDESICFWPRAKLDNGRDFRLREGVDTAARAPSGQGLSMGLKKRRVFSGAVFGNNAKTTGRGRNPVTKL